VNAEALISAAVGALAHREYAAAGDAYTRGARRVLSTPREGVDPFETDEKGWVGKGLEHLVTATLCYRVGDRPERASRRGVEAVAVARDFAEVVAEPQQKGCFLEFVADAKVAAGLDGSEEAYEAAAKAFRDAGERTEDPRSWATTPLFQAAAGPIRQAGRTVSNGEIAVTWEDLHGSDPGDPGEFLAARPRYKRRRFPSLVERVVADGHLAAPRGTTEYATDHHECPECGSTDVNWVADNVLCLRCSSPTVET
jgi:hypothetical protein